MTQRILTLVSVHWRRHALITAQLASAVRRLTNPQDPEAIAVLAGIPPLDNGENEIHRWCSAKQITVEAHPQPFHALVNPDDTIDHPAAADLIDIANPDLTLIFDRGTHHGIEALAIASELAGIETWRFTDHAGTDLAP